MYYIVHKVFSVDAYMKKRLGMTPGVYLIAYKPSMEFETGTFNTFANFKIACIKGLLYLFHILQVFLRLIAHEFAKSYGKHIPSFLYP